MELANVQADAVELLKQLVRTPSISGNEDAAARLLVEALKAYGFPKVTRNLNNVIIDCQGTEKGPTLLLCSHIDTVAVAPGWTRDPFGAAVEGDKIYGLGANDAAASVVSMIAAARLVMPLQKGRLIVCLAAEEESGGNGFVKIESELARYDAAIFGEPTNMGVATSMRGAMRVVVCSHGKAAHASRPWEGKNAADQFVKDMQALRAIDLKDNSTWGGATMEPTVIKGGESPNQLPGLIETTLDIRTTPDKNNEWVLGQLKQSGLDYKVLVDRRKPMKNDADAPLMRTIKSFSKQPDYTFNGTCDMAFSTAPAVVMGPGKSERSHVADEYIAAQEIHAAIPVYADIIRGFLNG